MVRVRARVRPKVKHGAWVKHGAGVKHGAWVKHGAGVTVVNSEDQFCILSTGLGSKSYGYISF